MAMKPTLSSIMVRESKINKYINKYNGNRDREQLVIACTQFYFYTKINKNKAR